MVRNVYVTKSLWYEKSGSQLNTTQRCMSARKYVIMMDEDYAGCQHSYGLGYVYAAQTCVSVLRREETHCFNTTQCILLLLVCFQQCTITFLSVLLHLSLRCSIANGLTFSTLVNWFRVLQFRVFSRPDIACFVLLTPPLFHSNSGVFRLQQFAHIGVSLSRWLKIFGRKIIFEVYIPTCMTIIPQHHGQTDG